MEPTRLYTLATEAEADCIAGANDSNDDENDHADYFRRRNHLQPCRAPMTAAWAKLDDAA